jgi:hypothetical protein
LIHISKKNSHLVHVTAKSIKKLFKIATKIVDFSGSYWGAESLSPACAAIPHLIFKRAMISVWELCHVDPVVVEELDFIQEEWNGADTKHSHEILTEVPSSSSAGFHSKEALDNKIQSLLCDTNESCKTALEVLDSVLIIVQDVKNAYFDVTGRTNSLIQKCEDLLDQQVRIEV